MATRKCPQCKAMRIPSSDSICGDCYAANTNEMIQVIEQHHDLLKKLDDGPPPLKMTLPLDSATRKEYPLMRGCLNYFPAALAGVAHISKLGNDKHNPGEELHHARGKSTDHGDCIVRHLIDLQDLLAAGADKAIILSEVSSLAWRALAYSQELHEKFGAPLAPGAKLPQN